jgi:RHS repeat-associated protein
VYAYDVQGRLAAEYSTASSTSPCTTCYLSADQLGSTRLVTDFSGSVVGRHDYLPFGEEVSPNTLDNISQKFTGQMRDAETGMDFFHARYFGAALGRFTSPDPGNAGADITNPQSWNAYGYVLGNPLALVDPSGLEVTCNGDTCIDNAPPACKWWQFWCWGGGGSGGGDAGGSDSAGGFGGSGLLSGAGSSQQAQVPPPRITEAQLSLPAKNGSCPAPTTGFGVGVLAGGSAEIGVVKAGAGVQGSVGAGLFVDGNFKPSAGAYASGGAVAYAGQASAAAPKQQGNPNVVGAYAGYGPGIFVTNAGSSRQLSGPFWTFTVNVGLGTGKASISLGSSGGVFIGTISGGPAPISDGLGLSFSTITTKTAATSTSRCP